MQPNRLETQKLRDVSEGIVQLVDESISPPNSAYLGLNVFFDKFLGRAEVRSGTTQLGSQIVSGKNCLGLFQHITTSGTKVPLAVFNNAGDTQAVLSKYTSNAWSNAYTTLTAGAKARFCTFLDTTAVVNGTDQISSADGSSWVTTGGDLDIGNMPAISVIEEFLDKVYGAGVSGNLDRLYASSLPVAGQISWTSGQSTIDIEPEEGAGPITALSKVPGYLLIFKERSMKRWDTKSTFPESLIMLGTPSQEAVVRTRQSCFFYTVNAGIQETTGGYPRKISRRVQDILSAVPSSYYPSISGHGDGEYLYYSIGDITLGDLSLTNCVVVYHIDSQSFTLLSFPQEFKRWHHFIDTNGAELIIAGDNNGNVFKVLDGTNGDGASNTPINFLLQYQTQEFGTRGRSKEISKMVAYTKRINNGRVSVRIDDGDSFKPYAKDSINKSIKELVGDLRARYFDIRIQGSALKGAHIIGLDFPEIGVNINYAD